MQYYLLTLTQPRPGIPTKEFTEIDDNRWEIRKVEIFPDDSSGYASLSEEARGTRISDKPWPENNELLRRLPVKEGYELVAISKSDFEEMWIFATQTRGDI